MDRKVGNGTLTPPLHTKMQIQLVLSPWDVGLHFDSTVNYQRKANKANPTVTNMLIPQVPFHIQRQTPGCQS